MHAETDNSIAEQIPDSHHVGGTSAPPVSRNQFLAKWPNCHYAVQLTVEDDIISKIVEYYHP